MAKITPKKSKPTQNPANGPTRRERLESKESAIVDAAYALFATKGFAKSTISEIAKSAGVAEGTVYLYFNNKEALAVGVLASFYDRLTQTADNGVAQLSTTVAKLEFLANHHLTSVIKERRILELLSIVDRDAESQIGGVIYSMNRTYVAIFDNIVKDGVWRGQIAEGYSPWILRDIFFGGLEYGMRTILYTDRHSQVTKFANELVRMISMAPGKPALSSSRDLASSNETRLDGVVTKLESLVEQLGDKNKSRYE